MSLRRYEFSVPKDLEEDLINAGLYVDDTEMTHIIREPVVRIRDRIRQELVEDSPVRMPSIDDINNPDVVLEPPFDVFREQAACPEPQPTKHERLLRDVLAMKPAMCVDEFPDIRQTYDLIMRMEPFSDNDPPDMETMFWARMAAFRIANVPFEQAEAIYQQFMAQYMVDPDVVDTADSSLVDDADRWLEIVKTTNPDQYDEIQACVDFIQSANTSRDMTERTIGLMLLQITHHQEMTTIETSSEMFNADNDDPIAGHRYRAPKVGHRGFDVTTFTPDQLREYLFMDELLADPAASYLERLNEINSQTDERYLEPGISDRQKIFRRFLELASEAREEHEDQSEIRRVTTDMTRRMGYSPDSQAVEVAYIVRHSVYDMLGLSLADNSADVDELYSADVSLFDAQWTVRAKKILQSLQGNEEFENKILAGVNFIFPDKDKQMLGQLIAAVTYDQIKHYKSMMMCKVGSAAVEAAHRLLIDQPEMYPDAHEEPLVDVRKHGLDATGFTEKDLVHLPLDEIMDKPQKPYRRLLNRLIRRKKPEFKDPELTASQQFALDILNVKNKADKQIISGSLHADNSADMARKLIGNESDMRIFKLIHRARLAAALVCGLEDDYFKHAARIYAIHTDVKAVTNGRPPLVSVADDAQIKLYRYDSTAKTIEACVLLLGDTDADTQILRPALCLAIDQIQTWQLRQQENTDNS